MLDTIRRRWLPAFPCAVLSSRALQTWPEEYREWWRVFRDPIHDRLIDIAYSQNLTLLSVGTKVLQARAALGW